MPQNPPPKTKKVDFTETLHGVEVSDPYRWLENDGDIEINQWVKSQNTYTRECLDKIPIREHLKNRFNALLYTSSFSVLVPKKGKYFFTERKNGEDLFVLYAQQGIQGNPKPLVNPNLSPKEKRASLKGWSPSRDGKIIAYGLSEAGNDQVTVHFMDTETGEKLSDIIPAEVYPSMPSAWEPDGSGFWYTRRTANVPKGEEKFHRKAYYHRMGDTWEKDEVIFGEEIKKEDYPEARLSEDGHYLLVTVGIASEEKHRSEIFLCDLKNKTKKFIPIIKGVDGVFSSMIHRDFIYTTTNFQAPSWKIMRIAIKDALLGIQAWNDVIPEEKEMVVESFRIISDSLFVGKTKNMVLHLYRYTLDGTLLSEIPLPAIGDITTHTGERQGDELIFGFTSFLIPHMIFRFDLKTGALQKIREAPGGIDPQTSVVQQMWYSSKDGTKIPMFLVHRNDMTRNGNNPLYLYGYGGFNINSGPSFNKSTVEFIQRGGIYAVANIRGGGELGEGWHEAGRRENKQNVFDDFIAAAEWLISEKYTRSDKLIISGWSNGGLLTSAVMAQRPELCKVVIIGAPVTDMLHFHKFFGGRHWIPEYGNPDDPKMFPHLFKYSPYHNIKDDVSFPAVLILTADRDDRVHPMHAYKITARLQAANASPNPILLRVETKAGHSGAVAVSELVERLTDMWAFIFEQIGWGGK